MTWESVDDLKKKNAKLERIVSEQNEMLQRLASPPFELAVIISIQGNRAMFNVRGKLVDAQISVPTKYEVGNVVCISPETGAIIEASPHPNFPGTMASVSKVVPGGVEIEGEGEKRVAMTNLPLKVGDAVVLDSSKSVVIRKGQQGDDKFQFAQSTGVTWNEVGGLESAKAAMIESIEMPYKHREMYAAYGRKRSKGVLVFGPPGCGKTLLGKAAATSLAATHGQKISQGFFFVKGPELLNKFVGESEANVRRLFQSAMEFTKKNGYPAIIMIDEADALLGTRETSGHIGMTKTIVPMFLAEMDGLEDSGAMVLLSTNRPKDLDSAIVRDGRIDKRVFVGRPTAKSTKDIFDINLRGVPMMEEGLSEYATGEVYATSRVMLNIVMKEGGEVKQMLLRHVLNGAMIAGIVERAKETAMRRDIQEGAVKGLSKTDFFSAINQTMIELGGIDHNEVIEEMIGDLGKVSHIQHVKA